MTVAAVQRIVGRYVAGTLDATAVRTLLTAIRLAPEDPVAPLVANVLTVLSESIPETKRRELLAKLVDGQQED